MKLNVDFIVWVLHLLNIQKTLKELKTGLLSSSSKYIILNLYILNLISKLMVS